MKTLISMTASAALLLCGATVLAQSVPSSFESKGFPITLHQAQILGLADLQEQFPEGGMQSSLCSPHRLRLPCLKPAQFTEQQLIAKLSPSGYSGGG